MLLDDNIILVLIGARVAINLQLRLQDLKVIERQNRVIGREIGSWGKVVVATHNGWLCA